MDGSFAADAGTDAADDLGALDAALTRLHGSGAAADLAALHAKAATALSHDPLAERFHLTHAFVYALVSGDDASVHAFEQRLAAAGGL